ncbi:sodium:solute symporter [Planctomycetota bacterium]|nr:sodium:solute symporter [Planctomycetota bacterium]
MDYLNTIDYIVIILYFSLLISISIYLKQKASKSLEDYLIGGRSLSWWMLGVSGTASFVDVAGTMLIVSFLFMLGPRGLFIEFRGGACLILPAMLLWTGKWHRRSKCITGAEWMIFRFGDNFGGRCAQLIAAFAGIVGTIGMLAYLIKGAGIFLAMFLPFSPAQCAVMLIVVATIYTMLSGFYGVVVTDFLQSGVILLAVIIISTLALTRSGSGDSIANLATQVTGNPNWTSAYPQWHTPMPNGYETYQALIGFMFFYLLRNIFGGMGSGGDPKYFGAKSDRDCAKMSFLWICLMSIRWPLMIGMAILGLLLVNDLFPDQTVLAHAAAAIKDAYPNITEVGWQPLLSSFTNNPETHTQTLISSLTSLLGDDWSSKLLLLSYHGNINPERIMPAVLLYQIPTGMRGLMLVALLAASMSTFDSTVNATAGLFTKDVYQKYIRPKASVKELIYASWLFIIVIVAIGFLFTYAITNINDIWDWIIMGLGAGLLVPTILRFYWWRFNGIGFAIGTFVGLVSAVIQRFFFSDIDPRMQFLLIGAIGLIATIAGSLLTKPTSEQTLTSFYQQTLPFGFWKPYKDKLPTELHQKATLEHKRDLLAYPFALIFQIAIFLIPMLALIKSYKACLITTFIAAAALIALYSIWLKHNFKDTDINTQRDQENLQQQTEVTSAN